MKNIISNFCDTFNITVDDLLSKSREKKIVDFRCLLAHMLVTYGYKFIYIAAVLNKDHSTITFYNKRAKNLLEVDNEFKELKSKWILRT